MDVPMVELDGRFHLESGRTWWDMIFLESVDSKFFQIRIYKSYLWVLICGFLLP